MIEKDLEKRIIDKIRAAMEAAGVTDVEYLGAWQPAPAGGIKDNEDGHVCAYVTVKAYPRSYDTPTIPDTTIDIDVSLLVRADIDADGHGYVEMTSTIADLFERWQKSYSGYHDDLTVDGFEPTGFRQGGGDIGKDADRCLWTYQMRISINGIITL